MAAANGLIEAAEATGNPMLLSFALFAYGFAFRDADPVGALRGPAPGPGDRSRQRQPHRPSRAWRAVCLASRPTHGDPLAALRLLHSGDPQLPRLGQHRHCCLTPWLSSLPSRPARTPRTGGHHRRVRAQSPHCGVAPRDQTPRSPTCAMCSATRPTNRSPARARR